MAVQPTLGIGRRAAGAVALAFVAMLVVPFVQRATADPNPASGGGTDLAAGGAACQAEHWVGGWTAAPQSSSLGRGTVPGRTFVDQTLRMVLSTRTGGSALRVRLGNRFGPAPVTIDAVTVAQRATGASVLAGSLRPVTFGGSPSVTVQPGGEALSDPVFGPVSPFDDLAVSFHVSGSGVVDEHEWAQSTQFATPSGAGNHAADIAGDAFTETLTGWFGVTGVDVLAPGSVGAIVTLGDSITDGIGSTPDRNRRWPDVLARRLQVAGADLSVVNAGIGGNHVVTSGLTSDAAVGPSTIERLDADALRVAGVTDLFVFEGINDIFKAEPGVDIATKVIDGYRTIIDRAHAAGLRVIGATVTPADMSGEKEAARQAINTWIRTSGAYDSVVDFDAVVRDPASPSHVRPEWNAYLAHLTDAGYDAMAHAIDPRIFRGTDC